MMRLTGFLRIFLLGGSLMMISCTSAKQRFENIEPTPDKSFFSVLKWRLFEKRDQWPKWVETQQFKVEKERVTGSELTYTVVNHATVLIQYKGLNILTDPIYSDRTSPVSWAGPKRVRKPGIAFEDLPPIDIVLISHNHYDHFDLETLKRLKEKFDPFYLVGLQSGPLLQKIGVTRYKELDWWQDLEFKGLQFYFVPAQHWSARGIFDKREMLWGGFSIVSHEEREEGRVKRHIYFAGDTGYGKFFRMIKEKIGAVDLAFIPIGAYEPRWFMKAQHLNPEEAIKAHEDIESTYSVGIHFETFQLTDEGYGKPREELYEKWKSKERRGEFKVPTFGENITLSF